MQTAGNKDINLHTHKHTLHKKLSSIIVTFKWTIIEHNNLSRFCLWIYPEKNTKITDQINSYNNWA